MDNYIIGRAGLQDKFLWTQRKKETLYLSELYRNIGGYDRYAERALWCSTNLLYGVVGGEKKLVSADFCNLRLCPLCGARRARKISITLSKMLDLVESKEDVKYLFLTLTVRNCDGEHLGQELKHLTESWHRLMCQRPVKAILIGWYRAVEITNKGRGYHPHIHAILAVSPDYATKKGAYITHDEWVRRWRKALDVDYDPFVHIQRTKSRGGDRANLASAKEAAKYAVKSDDYIGKHLPPADAAQRVADYTRALHHRRLIGYGGALKLAAQALDALDMERDADLVHIDDDDSIRGDIYELMMVYRWSFGARDYILSEVYEPPKEGGERDGIKDKDSDL